jgi:hypothetical protein
LNTQKLEASSPIDFADSSRFFTIAVAGFLVSFWTFCGGEVQYEYRDAWYENKGTNKQMVFAMNQR